MARLVSALLGLGLALGLTAACFVEDEGAVEAPEYVSGEPPVLTDGELAAAEPCSAMLASMVVADGQVETGLSCITCHAVPGTIPLRREVRDLPVGRRP
jgi:hypothetical protein